MKLQDQRVGDYSHSSPRSTETLPSLAVEAAGDTSPLHLCSEVFNTHLIDSA